MNAKKVHGILDAQEGQRKNIVNEVIMPYSTKDSADVVGNDLRISVNPKDLYQLWVTKARRSTMKRFWRNLYWLSFKIGFIYILRLISSLC